MNIEKIPIGQNAPEEVNVIIEVPMDSHPVKYEFDKESSAIFVDRFVHTAMHYPCNYGFIPHTMADDNDPLDALVITRYALIPGCVISVRPIGVLMMEDEKGLDEKIIAVPTLKIHKYYENVNNISDLPQSLIEEISHFFERYKDLEKGKWVKVTGYKDNKQAKEIIKKYIIK
jgi:inorganic pyrophosphatase